MSEDLKPWEIASKQQSEPDLKPWEEAESKKKISDKQKFNFIALNNPSNTDTVIQ